MAEEKQQLGEKDANEKTPILPTYFKADMADSSSTDPRATVRYLPSLKKGSKGRYCCILIFLILIALLIALIVGLAVGLSNRPVYLPNNIQSADLEELINSLQDTSVNDSRSVLNGYNDSAKYVMETLQENGYEPEMQTFIVPVFQNLGEAVFKVTIANVEYEFQEGTQFNVMTYSGACSNCVGGLVVVNEDQNYGCTDWSAQLPENTVVLMAYNDSKGGCSLYQKAKNALEKDAIAVIFARDEEDMGGPPASRVYEKSESGELSTVDIPAIGATSHVRKLLTNNNPTTINIETFTSVTQAVTFNVFARTKEGTNESVIVVGSHLDSVPAGPGMNDNGSGAMANLKLAIEIEKLGIKPKNQVMFAWWGAEELGLLGSTYYVAQLSQEQRDAIALNLNFDMIASPNYIRGVYNGTSANETILSASTTIQKVLVEYFENNDLAYEIVPFTGRSDYGPFIEVGIPAGGLFTGAEVRKTEEQYEKFGGLINAPLDPCYHQACDTTANVNYDVYEDMTRAAAYAVQTFMEQENLEDFLNSEEK